MKAVVAAFNQEKALVGAFSVIVQPVVEPMENYTGTPWWWRGAAWGRAGRGRGSGTAAARTGPRGWGRGRSSSPRPWRQQYHDVITTNQWCLATVFLMYKSTRLHDNHSIHTHCCSIFIIFFLLSFYPQFKSLKYLSPSLRRYIFRLCLSSLFKKLSLL